MIIDHSLKFVCTDSGEILKYTNKVGIKATQIQYSNYNLTLKCLHISFLKNEFVGIKLRSLGTNNRSIHFLHFNIHQKSMKIFYHVFLFVFKGGGEVDVDTLLVLKILHRPRTWND